MANTRIQMTVSPFIPQDMINSIELSLLRACGFSIEPDQKSYFLFSDESIELEPELGFDDMSAVLNSITDLYPEMNSRPAWVEMLRKGLETHCSEQPEDPEVGFLFNELDQELYLAIFQTILDRADGLIEFIDIEGAVSCDRMRLGAFGGFATRIYPDKVLSVDAGYALDDIAAIAKITSQLLHNWESGDLAGSVNELRQAVTHIAPQFMRQHSV